VSKTILIIDDKRNIREVLSAILQNEGYTVHSAENARQALERMPKIVPAIVITDLKLPGIDGIELVKRLKERDPGIPIIIITAFGSISSAVEAIKAGGYDYLTKPLDYERLKLLIRRALDQRRPRMKDADLRLALNRQESVREIVGAGPIMNRLLELISTVAPSNSSVLIQGESGTGKELVARAIFMRSKRKGGPFVVVDCSALPDDLLESELMGYEKGAFTGAVSRKEGRIELANGGTLFLDEIGEMKLPLQAKLLRLIQERRFFRIGGLAPIDVDFRLVAATNRDLKREVEAGRFRADLYYRLNVINITVPPLRDRREDIPLLARAAVKKIALRNEMPEKIIAPNVMDLLIRYAWPGNVRELENCIERMMVVCREDVISAECVPPELVELEFAPEGRGSENPPSLEDLEREAIIAALQKANGNKSEAARLLRIDRKALYNRLMKYHLSIEAR
jgi:two-component system response regulator HydG